MKVKELMEKLNWHNPNDEVAIWLRKDECWKIETVDTDAIHHHKNPEGEYPEPYVNVVHLHIHEDCNYRNAISYSEYDIKGGK